MPDREDMKSILEACRRTGPMDESLVRGTVESSSSNSEEYHADAMRGTNYLQFSCDENGNEPSSPSAAMQTHSLAACKMRWRAALSCRVRKNSIFMKCF
jgi:hypothetical protein